MWLFAIVIVLALGGIALVAAGVGSPMGEEYGDRPDVAVPVDRQLGAADLRRVRFSVGLRGYQMDEVDALLARLAAEAEERERARDTAGSVAEAVDEAREEVAQPDEPGADATQDARPAADGDRDAE